MAELALVTGAHGFIGRHVSRHLAAAGWAVVGVGHGNWVRDEWLRWGLRDWRTADITLESLVTYAAEASAVIHCAGGASVTFSVAHPYEDFRRSVDSTAAVLEFARLHARGARVVLASSAGVYGEVPPAPISESAPCMPVSPYGAHKKMAEELCRSFSRVEGLATAVVRLFSVYGPGLRKQLLWDACERLARGENRFFGTGTEVRDWLHVEDAAALLVVALGSAGTGCPVFNGGTGAGTSVRDVLGTLFQALGRTDEPSFSAQARTGDPSTLVADASRAFGLGWRPAHAWRDGIAAFAAWHQAGAK